MKRIISLFFMAAFSTAAFAQSFDKGNRNFDFRIDFAGYSGTVKDNQTDSVSESGAAGFVYTPQMTWGTGKKISIGTSLAYSSYFVTADSASPGSKPSLKSLDLNFLFDYHFLRTPKTDIMAGLRLGMAGIRFKSDDGTGDIYGSMGRSSDIHFLARFYVSEKIGIIANMSFPSYRYSKFGKNLETTHTINFRGLCIGTGIAVLLSKKGDAAAAK